MKMVWGPEAVAELRARFGTDATGFRLVYDTEGCGCAVNGVPALWAVDGPEPGDKAADSEPFATWYDPGHAVYFDDTLQIEYLPDRKAFRLSSDSQIYTVRMALSDHRMQQAGTVRRP